ncbi:MAG: T9SS type A sorting domain-containing protein [Flavobacteriales bacterium]|nr:T9SS type A sorting domain-containing protein [Flavobacteriales bacterium]
MIRTLLFASLFCLVPRLFAFDVQFQVQHATCGAATGSVWAYANSGVWPYTYLWNTGSTASSLLDVAPGVYSVTMTDAEGSTATGEAEILATTALFPPVDPVTVWSCIDDDCSGTLYHYFYGPNGVGPYTIDFDTPGPQGQVSSGVYFYGLCAGTTYNVTITDSEGCTAVYGPITVQEAPEPTLTVESITPSCPQGSTGAFTISYDMLDSIFVTGPDQNWYSVMTNPFTLTNLSPGEYILSGYTPNDNLPYGVYGTNCYFTDTIVVPETTEPCGNLSGIVFADVDDNCAQNGGEPGLPFRVLAVEPGGHLAMTASDGTYARQYLYNSYTLDASIDGYASDCTTLPAAFTLDAGTPTAVIDLPMSPTFGPDLSVYVYLNGAVPGFYHDEYVHVANDGPYTFTNVVLDLYHDPLLTYYNCATEPDLVEAGHLQWVIADMAAFSSFNVAPVFTMPTGAGLIGTVITSDASITLDSPDSNTDNDADQATRTITGSYDPNDKLAETSSRLSGTSYYLDHDQYVDYTIRFQNTGTGPAYNVYLLDTISPLLDLTSFTMLAASHAFEASLGDERALRFDFFNIMLPDSGSDMTGSQGFVSFRLRPVQSLAVGQQLVNAADIYFDFNEPIHTNDAVLVVEQSTGIGETEAAALVVYPNPVTDLLRIDLTGGAVRMDVISADGRAVFSQRASTGTNQFDTRALTPGAYSIRVLSASGSVQHARFVKR